MDHAMAYDSLRKRVLLFGGWYMSGETASFMAWDGTQWSDLPTGPEPRLRAVMTYDSARDRVVVFGGQDYPTIYTDTWEFDGATWTRRATTGPVSNTYNEMVYDRSRGKTVLFDGINVRTWEWDGSQWVQVASTGPTPRTGFALAYDAARHRTVLFGGLTNNSPLTLSAETWEWDGIAWQLRSPASTPGPREEHVMAFDEHRGRTLLFGGYGGGSNYFRDTWEWDGVAWVQVSPLGPPYRTSTAAAFDAERQRLVLHGGQTNTYLGDTWEYREAP
jgi:hypothetical protein